MYIIICWQVMLSSIPLRAWCLLLMFVLSSVSTFVARPLIYGRYTRTDYYSSLFTLDAHLLRSCHKIWIVLVKCANFGSFLSVCTGFTCLEIVARFTFSTHWKWRDEMSIWCACAFDLVPLYHLCHCPPVGLVQTFGIEKCNYLGLLFVILMIDTTAVISRF